MSSSADAAARDAPPRKPRGPSRRLRIGAAIGSLVVLAIVIFLVLFQWNWLRGPLARAISHRVHRPVAITGNLEVHPWSWPPTATVNGLVIGNAPWAGKAPLASLPRLTVQMKVLPLLLRGKVILPLVEADRPDVGLLRDAQGRANWVFNPNQPPKPLKLPAINHLIIRDGALRYDDVKRRLHFTGTVSSNEEVNGVGRGVFALEGKGTLNDEPFLAHVRGGPLIGVDPSRPYDFEGRVVAGPTQVRLEGRIDHPFDFSALSGKFYISGPDLADVYALTGLALPNTPPYSLAAGFARRQAVYALSGIRGRVGLSDLAGGLTVNDSTGRPFVNANLASRRLRLSDLVAVIGGAPRHGKAADLSPMEKVEGARMKAEHRILPNTHLDVARVRGMDARLAYRAQSVDAGRLPIRGLRLDLSLNHGVLVANPLELILPQGRLAGDIRIDARKAVPAESLDLRLTNARLENLVKTKGGGPPAIEGGLYARAKLSGAGDSIRAAAASADGQVTIAMPGGAIRQSFAEMTGIDLARGLYLLLTKSKQDTPIRCGVADFQARRGVLTLDRGVIDTGVVMISGTGDVSLRDETMNLRLSGKPKKFRLLRLNAPITIKGALTHPKIGVDVAKAAPQALISAAIGIFAAPAAVILPFLDPGFGKNANCAALLH